MEEMIVQFGQAAPGAWDKAAVIAQVIVVIGAFGVALYAHHLANRRAARKATREAKLIREALAHEARAVKRFLESTRKFWTDNFAAYMAPQRTVEIPAAMRSIDTWIRLDDETDVGRMSDVVHNIEVYNQRVRDAATAQSHQSILKNRQAALKQSIQTIEAIKRFLSSSSD